MAVSDDALRDLMLRFRATVLRHQGTTFLSYQRECAELILELTMTMRTMAEVSDDISLRPVFVELSSSLIRAPLLHLVDSVASRSSLLEGCFTVLETFFKVARNSSVVNAFVHSFIKPLLQAAAHTDHRVVDAASNAVKEMMMCVCQTEFFMTLLNTGCHDKHPRVRCAALQALTSFIISVKGTPRHHLLIRSLEEVLFTIRHGLEDANGAVRRCGIRCFWCLSVLEPQKVAVILPLLRTQTRLRLWNHQPEALREAGVMASPSTESVSAVELVTASSFLGLEEGLHDAASENHFLYHAPRGRVTRAEQEMSYFKPFLEDDTDERRSGEGLIEACLSQVRSASSPQVLLRSLKELHRSVEKVTQQDRGDCLSSVSFLQRLFYTLACVCTRDAVVKQACLLIVESLLPCCSLATRLNALGAELGLRCLSAPAAPAASLLSFLTYYLSEPEHSHPDLCIAALFPSLIHLFEKPEKGTRSIRHQLTKVLCGLRSKDKASFNHTMATLSIQDRRVLSLAVQGEWPSGGRNREAGGEGQLSTLPSSSMQVTEERCGQQHFVPVRATHQDPSAWRPFRPSSGDQPKKGETARRTKGVPSAALSPSASLFPSTIHSERLDHLYDNSDTGLPHGDQGRDPLALHSCVDRGVMVGDRLITIEDLLSIVQSDRHSLLERTSGMESLGSHAKAKPKVWGSEDLNYVLRTLQVVQRLSSAKHEPYSCLRRRSFALLRCVLSTGVLQRNLPAWAEKVLLMCRAGMDDVFLEVSQEAAMCVHFFLFHSSVPRMMDDLILVAFAAALEQWLHPAEWCSVRTGWLELLCCLGRVFERRRHHILTQQAVLGSVTQPVSRRLADALIQIINHYDETIRLTAARTLAVMTLCGCCDAKSVSLCGLSESQTALLNKCLREVVP